MLIFTANPMEETPEDTGHKYQLIIEKEIKGDIEGYIEVKKENKYIYIHIILKKDIESLRKVLKKIKEKYPYKHTSVHIPIAIGGIREEIEKIIEEEMKDYLVILY